MFKAPKRKRPTVIKRTDDSDDENQEEVQNANNTSTQDKINETKKYFFKGLFENPGCMENFLLGICSDMNIIASNFLGKIKLMLIYVRLQVP